MWRGGWGGVLRGARLFCALFTARVPRITISTALLRVDLRGSPLPYTNRWPVGGCRQGDGSTDGRQTDDFGLPAGGRKTLQQDGAAWLLRVCVVLLLALAAALAVAGVYVRDAASQEATEP